MPVRGKHQLQITPAEMIVILTGIERLLADRKLSPLERAIAESTQDHLSRSKVYE